MRYSEARREGPAYKSETWSVPAYRHSPRRCKRTRGNLSCYAKGCHTAYFRPCILGEDLALEGLNEYLKRRNRDLNKLMKLADVCRVRETMGLYLKAALA